jgi:DNA-binding transcriptional regulator YiaG
MKHAKRTRLERKGWRVGSAEDFLDLNPAEAAIIETKLALSRSLRDRRAAEGLSQAALARRLSSSQSRVAKMEAGDSTVSIDLLLRALYSLGARPRDVASILARRRGAAA